MDDSRFQFDNMFHGIYVPCVKQKEVLQKRETPVTDRFSIYMSGDSL